METNEKNKADRLKTSLEKLESVAFEIENLAKTATTDEDIETIQELTAILEEMTSALAFEEVRLSVDINFNKKNKEVDEFEENIKNMLKYLQTVVEDLKKSQLKSVEENRRPKQLKGFDTNNEFILLFDDRPKKKDPSVSSVDNSREIRRAYYRRMLTDFYDKDWNIEINL